MKMKMKMKALDNDKGILSTSLAGSLVQVEVVYLSTKNICIVQDRLYEHLPNFIRRKEEDVYTGDVVLSMKLLIPSRYRSDLESIMLRTLEDSSDKGLSFTDDTGKEVEMTIINMENHYHLMLDERRIYTGNLIVETLAIARDQILEN